MNWVRKTGTLALPFLWQLGSATQRSSRPKTASACSCVRITCTWENPRFFSHVIGVRWTPRISFDRNCAAAVSEWRENSRARPHRVNGRDFVVHEPPEDLLSEGLAHIDQDIPVSSIVVAVVYQEGGVAPETRREWRQSCAYNSRPTRHGQNAVRVAVWDTGCSCRFPGQVKLENSLGQDQFWGSGSYLEQKRSLNSDWLCYAV